jgi:hypothetical protein
MSHRLFLQLISGKDFVNEAAPCRRGLAGMGQERAIVMVAKKIFPWLITMVYRY